MLDQSNHRLRHIVELTRGGEQPRWRRAPMTVWNTGQSAVDGFLRNYGFMRASVLAYTVALSIVPILALAFSALKGFGNFNRMRSFIEHNLAVGSPQITHDLMSYVARTNAAALGAAGAAFLIITVLSTMGTVEFCLNKIWRTTRSRSYLRMFTDYLSVLFTVPLLLVGALTVTAIFSVSVGHVPFLAGVLPYLIVWTGFFLLYIFFPYTYVSFRAAAIGSFVAAILFQIAQLVYVRFQIGVASYEAIYGAIAAIPVFLVWIYLAWIIVLFGAEVSAAVQRGEHACMLPPTSPEFTYIAALYVLLRLADEHARGARPVTISSMALELGVDPAHIQPIVERLRIAGSVIDAGDPKVKRHGLLLGRAASEISLRDAVGVVPADTEEHISDKRLRNFLHRLRTVENDVLGSLTLEDLEKKPPAESTARSESPSGAKRPV
ncbi:MAG: YhjD/YihY/BrkB family envelope integrity protein [Candidatus Binataceae bacterium]